MSVVADYFSEGLYIRAEANDVDVGQEDGDGIAYVDIFIQDLHGNVIAARRENNAPYCYFGEQDGECIRVHPDSNAFRWSENRPREPGWYFVRAVAYTPDSRIQVFERPVRITIPADDLETIFITFELPGTDRIFNQLEYQVSVSGEGTQPGIERVEMFVVAYDGQLVSGRQEFNPNYCGFGDDGLNTPCYVYNFAHQGFKWPGGADINPTQYVLRAVTYIHGGGIGANTFIIQIDHLQSN
jgi:hypothetical protein